MTPTLCSSTATRLGRAGASEPRDEPLDDGEVGAGPARVIEWEATDTNTTDVKSFIVCGPVIENTRKYTKVINRLACVQTAGKRSPQRRATSRLLRRYRIPRPNESSQQC